MTRAPWLLAAAWLVGCADPLPAAWEDPPCALDRGWVYQAAPEEPTGWVCVPSRSLW